MSNTNKNEKVEQDPENALGELDQLRKIVFGDAQQQLLEQLALLRSDMEKALHSQDHKFSVSLEKTQEDFTKKLEELDKRLQFVDKMHDDNEANIQKEHESLVSEYEMFTAATQQDFKNLEQSLDNESNSLSNNFNDQLEQLKNHLEVVSKELSSSKTDRKTLAKLLATMATNLEDDQL
jgi:hypothetical protein